MPVSLLKRMSALLAVGVGEYALTHSAVLQDTGSIIVVLINARAQNNCLLFFF